MSKVTISLGAYIIISAAFMLQARNWLFNTFGAGAVTASFKICFMMIFALMALYPVRKPRPITKSLSNGVYAFKLRLSPPRIFALSVLFALGYIFAARQPYFAEKTHVLTYGLLGYLASGDAMTVRRRPGLRRIVVALSFVALISGLDETFQWFLPYRVGEFRDFVTNMISGTLGMALFFVFKEGHPDKDKI